MTQDIKIGDVVHVRAKMLRLGVIGIPILRLVDGYASSCGDLHVEQSYIVHVEPRPLQVGDNVRHVGGNESGEVIGLTDTHAWVKCEHGPISERLADLVRVP